MDIKQKLGDLLSEDEALLQEKIQNEYKSYLEKKYGVTLSEDVLQKVELDRKKTDDIKYSYSKNIKEEIDNFYDLGKILDKMNRIVIPVDLPTFDQLSDDVKSAYEQEFLDHEKLLKLQIEEVKKSFAKNASYRNDHTIMKIIELLENEDFDFRKDVNLKKIQEIILNYSADLSRRSTELLNYSEFKNITIFKSNFFIEAGYCYNLVTQKILAIALSKLESYADILGYEFEGKNKKIHEQNRRMVYIYTHDLVRYLGMDSSNASKALDQFEKDIKSLETLFLREANGDHVYIDTGNYFDDAKGVNISTGRTPRTMLKLTNMIGISFTDDFLAYVTNLKSNYTSYSISAINDFTSKYSLRLYEIAKRYLGIHKVVIPLDKMYFMLDLSSDPSFKAFNSKIFKPAILDINKNSDITVYYDFIKVGRKVSQVQLRIYEGKVSPAEAELIEFRKESANGKTLGKEDKANEITLSVANEFKEFTEKTSIEKLLTYLDTLEPRKEN